MSIPASALVSVNPGVIAPGGGSVSLVGLFLTKNTRIPIGQVVSFPSLVSVVSYFGAAAQEATLAGVYFSGFNNSTTKPGAMLFYQYAGGSVAAYLRGGNVSTLTLAQLQALSGVLTLTVNGTSTTSATINLSAATSFSNAASLIQAGFTSPAFTVSFDSISGAFVFTNTSTGASSTITVATGSLAAGLALTTATGALTSQGAIAATPATAMTAVTGLTSNFATFTTAWEPSVSDHVAFASWTSSQNDTLMYVAWTTDITLTNSVPATASAAYAIAQAAYNGTFMIYAPVNGANAAAFVCGSAASLNFSATNGRTSFAYMSQAGLAPDVTNQAAAANIIANGANFYGQYGTAAASFNILFPGSVSGAFAWADSYVDQIQLNSSLQSALLALLSGIGSVPYNADGYSYIRNACSGPIAAALNFGSIRPGVTLSTVQSTEVNAAAGFNITPSIQNLGWYLLIQPTSPSARAARQSPPVTLFYTDGQSVNTISLASLEVA